MPFRTGKLLSVQLTDISISFLALESNGQEIHLTGLADQALAPGQMRGGLLTNAEELGGELFELINQYNWLGWPAAINISLECGQVKYIEIPRQVVEMVEDQAVWEAVGGVTMNPADWVLDLIPLNGESDDPAAFQSHLFLRKAVQQRSDLLRDAGLNPREVIPSPVSLYNLSLNAEFGAQGEYLLCWVEDEETTLTLVRNGEFVAAAHFGHESLRSGGEGSEVFASWVDAFKGWFALFFSAKAADPSRMGQVPEICYLCGPMSLAGLLVNVINQNIHVSWRSPRSLGNIVIPPDIQEGWLQHVPGLWIGLGNGVTHFYE